MKFNKYSESKDSVTIGSFASLNTNTNNSSSSTDAPTRGGGSSAGDRILWGQLDDGGDLDNSMMVKGNIYIKPSVGYDENGEDGDKDIDGTDEDFNFDWDEDTDGGSLYVEKKKEVKACHRISLQRDRSVSRCLSGSLLIMINSPRMMVEYLS